MYLTTKEEYLEITDIKMVQSLVNKLSEKSEDFVNYCDHRVKYLMWKRFVKNRPFENQKHAFRYIALIVLKGCRVDWYKRKDKNTFAYDSNFFSGDWDENSEVSVLGLCSDESMIYSSEPPDVEKALEVVAKSMRKEFPLIADDYIDYKARGKKRPKSVTDKNKKSLDLMFEFKIREYARQL
jgi:hypothetical protein